MALWQFILTDLAGTVVGEVATADARKVTLSHQRVGSVSFTMPMTDRYATNVINTDCLIKAYRIDPIAGTHYLAFNGPVVTVEEAADGTNNSLAVTCADPMWRLTKRLIPGSLLRTSTQYGTSGSPLDLGTIAHTILADVNGVNFSGISAGSRTNSRTGFYKCPPLKNAAEAIAELHAGANSFEFVLVPTEPTAVGGVGGWPQLATMNIAPLVGQARPDAVFEYGTTRANIASYSRQVSRENMLNRAITSVQGWPDGTLNTLSDRSDATSITNRGRFEDVVPDGGVIDANLRDAIGDLHVAVRKDPRNIITFRPAPNNALRPFIDYAVGDTVRARAVVGGTLRFDVNVRIWGVTFDIDKNGSESVELEMVMP